MPPHARIAGLDGLRAVAVVLVVASHLFPGGVLRSGFIGVDVFFVISGFLITSLLLRERARTGTIALRRFWVRRARRLLPALVVVVTVGATAAWLVGGDVLVGIGVQVLGAATFSYNWLSIADGASYFSAADPEVFRNVWSLAVEEQFYLLWPLLLPLVLLLPTRLLRASAAAAAAAASAAWAGVSAASGADLTRVYFGTDTHAFGLLIGVALAFALHGAVARRPSISGVGPVWGIVAGCAAVAGLVLVAALNIDAAAAFPMVSIIASLLTALAIAVGAWPGSWFGRGLDAAPLKWVGERSYGLYLWHWPLMVLATVLTVGAAPDTGVPVPVGLGVAALSLACAELSYRFVEQPVRRMGFRGAVSAVRMRLTARPRQRLSALGTLSLAVLALGGTTAAVAAAPPETTSQAAVERGRHALAETPAESPAESAAEPPGPSPGASDVPVPSPARTDVPPRAPSDPVDGAGITAIGDSVMLASAESLLERFPGIAVDAEVSRSAWAGVTIMQDLADAGRLRDHIVVALGTNGAVDPEALQKMQDIAGPDRRLVLVNAFAPRDWIPGVNDELARFATRQTGVTVADWSAAIGGRTDLLAGDGIHPGAAGGEVFAATVDTALRGADEESATAAWAIERIRGEILPVLREAERHRERD